MSKHQQRIQQALQNIENNDISLGFRKLLDCATDTQSMEIYNQAIALTDWKENNPTNTTEFVERAKTLLANIEKHSVNEVDTQQAVLVAKDIQKQYGLGSFVLGPISVEIKKGQVYGLVGENGNGKTTLLRILANDLSFNIGTLEYNFRENSKNEYDLKTKLVYIPQRTAKWYGSLKENLKFVLANYGIPPKENETRTLMMIARLGLWKYKDLKWSELSSGYKMRFELARTLLRKPELLLLDEPLGNLDVMAQQIILEDLKMIANSVNNPIALILSSQQLYEVEKISDKVIFLKNGKYTDNSSQSKQESIDNPLIVEIDTTNSREELISAFASLPLEKLNYNGGIYIAYFQTNTDLSEVLSNLGKSKISITYLRNISSSTRRFFVN
ncbi:ATP-binding cassette domain-containing protein [Capnocytophaga stomatis]|uniref:ABC transporter ATP-binding protein n=1 Tax=Capnocytophaga stomatis TaxID=1848904 RepID=A0A250FTT1_9FLAO|nr:ATP-binding cassette domain-containing protein [Capnocytophaga stomatis]ATA88562.1 ABC transporter ATP-binding protein [Capnocytophaga stomatis]